MPTFLPRVATAALLSCASGAARAAVLTFEDLDPGAHAIAPLPSGYAGFTWRGAAYVARPYGTTKPVPSLLEGTVGLVSIFSDWDMGSISLSSSDRFSFLGAYVTAARDWYEEVDVEGWRDGACVRRQTLAVVWNRQWFQLDFLDVDEVRLVPRGGAIVLDDVEYVAVDDEPPTLEFLSPSPDAAVRGAFDAAVLATDPSGIATVLLTFAGGTAIPASGSGPWFAAIEPGAGVPDGAHPLVATAVDGAGNAAARAIDVVVDRTPPVVTLSGPAAGSPVSGPVSISAHATDGTSGVRLVRIAANGIEVATCSGDGPCVATVDTAALLDGAFEIVAVAADRAGNESAAARLPLVADNTAPERFMRRPTPGAEVAGSMDVAVDVQDPGFASVECAAGGVTLGVSIDRTAAWTVDLSRFLDGPLAIACTATDLAGNARTELVAVTVRNWRLEPSPTVLHLGGGPSASFSIRVAGTNVALLTPASVQGLTLVIPGGSTVPLDARAGSEQVGDSDRDGIPDVTLKFGRAALASAIAGAIASGAIAAGDPVPLSLVSGGERRLGTTTVDVR